MRDWFREVETFADIYYVSRLLLRLQFWMKFMDITSTKFTILSLQWWANKDDNFTSPAQLPHPPNYGRKSSAVLAFRGDGGLLPHVILSKIVTSIVVRILPKFPKL